jgi:hypothetical protein
MRVRIVANKVSPVKVSQNRNPALAAVFRRILQSGITDPFRNNETRGIGGAELRR